MSNGTGRKKPSPGPSCEPARPVLTAARHSESPHCLSVALPRHTVTCTSFGPWHFFSCLHIPFTLKNLTEETFWKVPIPLCVPWLSYPESQTTILNGTLVVSPCRDSPGQELSGKPTYAIPVEEKRW